MVASVTGTIRLDNNLTGPITPTATYKVRTTGWQDEHRAQITVDYGVTGVAHPHRATDGAGSIVQHTDHIYNLIMTWAEYTTVIALIGKIMYFMPNYRDEADVSYREVVVFEEMRDIALLDTAQMSYITGTVILRGCAGATVDAP